MKELVKMVVVLTIISTVSGTVLALAYAKTKDQIELQRFVNEKKPAIMNILKGISNDPQQDNFTIDDDGVERKFYVGAFDGNANAVVFEAYGIGFEGDVGVMVGVNVEDKTILGIGITTHKETPGIGSRAKEEPDLAERFKGLTFPQKYEVKKYGGNIDAISGATITSSAVCKGVTSAADIYERNKSKIEEQTKTFSK